MRLNKEPQRDRNTCLAATQTFLIKAETASKVNSGLSYRRNAAIKRESRLLAGYVERERC